MRPDRVAALSEGFGGQAFQARLHPREGDRPANTPFPDGTGTFFWVVRPDDRACLAEAFRNLVPETVGRRIFRQKAQLAGLGQPVTAEMAVTCEDGDQGGVRHPGHLAAIGRERGVEGFVAEVLPEDAAMPAVFEHSGSPMAASRYGGAIHSPDWGATGAPGGQRTRNLRSGSPGRGRPPAAS